MKSIEHPAIRHFFLIISILLIIAIFLGALYFPVLEHDVWWYHLPFAGMLHNVDNFREKFHFVGFIAQRYEGFPKFMNWIQGLLWSWTGELGGLALPNAISLTLYIIFCWGWLELHPALLLPLLLSIPLVAIHATSAYIDLCSSMSVAIQFLSGLILSKLNQRRFLLLTIIYLLAAILAGNSKFNSTLSCLIVGSIFIVWTFCKRPSNYRKLITVFLIGVLVSSISIFHNAIVFKNPFYPISVAGLHGPERSTDNNSSFEYTDFLGPFEKPVEWSLSITEVDWKIRGVTPAYNVLSYAGDNSTRFGRGRSGGCWGVFMVANFVLLGFLTFRNKMYIENYFLRDLILLFGILTILTAWLPHSLKMRFYLYVPILLLTINAYTLSNWEFPKALNRLIVAAWCILCFSWLTNPGIILDQWSKKPSIPGLSSYSTPLTQAIFDPDIVAEIESAKQ